MNCATRQFHSTLYRAMNRQTDPRPIVIRRTQLPAMLGISLATIDRLRVAGSFVKPIRLGEQAIGFMRADIEAWLASRPLAAHFIETV